MQCVSRDVRQVYLSYRRPDDAAKSVAASVYGSANGCAPPDVRRAVACNSAIRPPKTCHGFKDVARYAACTVCYGLASGPAHPRHSAQNEFSPKPI